MSEVIKKVAKSKIAKKKDESAPSKTLKPKKKKADEKEGSNDESPAKQESNADFEAGIMFSKYVILSVNIYKLPNELTNTF